MARCREPIIRLYQSQLAKHLRKKIITTTANVARTAAVTEAAIGWEFRNQLTSHWPKMWPSNDPQRRSGKGVHWQPITQWLELFCNLTVTVRSSFSHSSWFCIAEMILSLALSFLHWTNWVWIPVHESPRNSSEYEFSERKNVNFKRNSCLRYVHLTYSQRIVSGIRSGMATAVLLGNTGK